MHLHTKVPTVDIKQGHMTPKQVMSHKGGGGGVETGHECNQTRPSGCVCVCVCVVPVVWHSAPLLYS